MLLKSKNPTIKAGFNRVSWRKYSICALVKVNIYTVSIKFNY